MEDHLCLAWQGADVNYRLFVFTLSGFVGLCHGTFLSSPEHWLLWGFPDLWAGDSEGPGQGQSGDSPSWSGFLIDTYLR